jgi:endonuclease YncB( thermonuclease family)
VIDGNTLICDRKIPIRLCGIDAPETGQPFSKQAQNLLLRLTLNKNITIIPITRDKYGRIIAEIWHRNLLINIQLLNWGLAYAHHHNCPTPQTIFQLAQQSAQTHKLNIWSSPQTPPWLYRKIK